MATQFLRRLGMVGLTVASVTLFAAPQAQAAALPPVAQQMIQAMQNMHSYKMTMDASDGPTSNTHMVAIYLRNGKTVEYYVKMQISAGKSSGITTEMIMNGSQFCMRGVMGPKWTCSKSNTAITEQTLSMADISKLWESLGSKYSLKSLGQATVQGQHCDGFAVTATTTYGTTKGTLWVNSSSHLLIEEDMVSSVTVVKGSKPTNGTIKVVISNYNDPSLTIPKV